MRAVLENDLHLPDLLFVDLCEAHFGINRGVYNTIDAWLYQHGFVDILDRRRNILFFLESIKPKAGELRQRFGPGGLASRLNDYYSKLYMKTGT